MPGQPCFGKRRVERGTMAVAFRVGKGTVDIKNEILKLNFVSLHEVIHKLITRYVEFIEEVKEEMKQI